VALPLLLLHVESLLLRTLLQHMQGLSLQRGICCGHLLLQHIWQLHQLGVELCHCVACGF
jgi:hypothetical protein